MVYYLQGTLQEEHDFNLREILKENCAIAGAVDREKAGRDIYNCLSRQRNRGDGGAGIFTVGDMGISYRKRIGSIQQQFDTIPFEKELPWVYGIWHTRYATIGKHGDVSNLQPLYFKNTKFWSFALAHNGTLPQIKPIKERLLDKWAIFQSETDSEIFAYLITTSPKKTLEEAIVYAAEKIKLAYSLLIMTEDKIIALRDRYGVRPLHVAKMKTGWYLIASETHAFSEYVMEGKVEEEIEIQPGEMKVFPIGKYLMESHQYAEPEEHRCVFEWIYFSHPRSKHHGKYHEDFRMELGKRIFQENPTLQWDCIVPIPDSGNSAAEWLSLASGIPMIKAFMREHNPAGAGDRSFIEPNTAARKKSIAKKLDLRADYIKDKHVITVDDSIVRSNTQFQVNEALRKAGVKWITTVIPAPPILNICELGIDIPTKEELIACICQGNIDEIRRRINSNILIYLSKEWLEKTAKEFYNSWICSWCFGGKYAGQ